MKWQDIYDIVEKLEDKFPQENILQIRYTDLHKMIIELDGFNDDPNKSNEKTLEAIQMLWLQERG
jgi:FeS assembly protein IscX